MNYKIKLGFLLIFVPLIAFTMPSEHQDFWICKAHDNTHIEWSSKNSYQKIALNVAFDACKKQSKNPISCKISTAACEKFHRGHSTKPAWRCTALDRTAAYWRSNHHIHKDEAIMVAKEACHASSNAPETCYVNLITCLNLNEEL